MAEKTQQVSSLEELPDVVLQHIFNYLDNFDLKQTAVVSKKFHKLSRNKNFISSNKINLDKITNIDHFDNTIWCYPELNISGSDTKKILQFTTLHGHLVKYLQIKECNSNEYIFDILKETPNLSAFDICFNGTDKVVPYVNKDLSNLPPIREFKYRNFDDNDVYLKQMLTILKNADRKVKINFYLSFTTSKMLDLLNENLQELNIMMIGNDESLTLNLIFEKLKLLEKLTIRSPCPVELLINHGLANELKYLKLTGATIQRNNLLQLFETFKNLTTLKFMGCNEFQREYVILVFKHLKNLQEFQCTDHSSSRDVDCDVDFPRHDNITKISLNIVPRFPEKFLINIAENAPNLKELILEHTIKLETIDSVKCILKKCRYLKKLYIHKVKNDYNAICEKESSTIILDNLEYLSLDNVMIYDDFIFPKLKEFKAGYCPGFTKEMLERIAINCPFLETLGFFQCGAIKATFITDLMRSGKFQMLKSVSLCLCNLPKGATLDENYFGGVPQFMGEMCFKCRDPNYWRYHLPAKMMKNM